MTDTLAEIDAALAEYEVEIPYAYVENRNVGLTLIITKATAKTSVAALRKARALIPEPPTGDERAALKQLLINNRARGHQSASYQFDPWDMTNAILAAGFRRHAPSTVTDAEVEAGARAHHIYGWGDDLDPHSPMPGSDLGAMRAALEAARKARS